MARLNTAKAQTSNDSKRRSALTEWTSLASDDSLTSQKRTATKRTDAKDGIPRRPQTVSSRRQNTSSSGEFDIFTDSDRMGESGRDESSPTKRTKARTLKTAQVNSLLLPLSQRPRQRQSDKVETDDYDKENDLTEDEPSPIPRRRNTARTPARSIPSLREQQHPESEAEEEDAADTSSNSLDDFVVSDNDEISYHETSDSETDEDERTPSPSPSPAPQSTRKKLMRGRRPDPDTELRKALSKPFSLRLEPSLQEPIKTPSKPAAKPKRLFHKDSDISTELNQPSLDGDNDPVSQLESERESSSQSQTAKPQTPPATPPRGRLRSPTKDKIRIPPTPHRESVDAFWNQEETNDWIDQHSPRKEKFSGCSVIELLQEFEESDGEDEEDNSKNSSIISVEPETMSPIKAIKTPSKSALKKAEAERKRELRARRMSFDTKKGGLAEDFLRVLDDAAADGGVRRLAESTGGVKIVWSKTLKTTAGRAHWKGERMRPSSSSSSESDGPRYRHHAMIELAERIIDNEDRLLNTLAHEYCHLANYMISNVHKNPHGPSFKQWGRKCSDVMSDHPVYGGRVTVTTKHNYKIDWKYVWACEGCAVTYGRHSKSIDTTRSRCGACAGHLVQIKPKPRNMSPRKNNGSASLEDVTRELGQVTL
jgi:predicted SprT family Zn-dependent metalloprotease